MEKNNETQEHKIETKEDAKRVHDSIMQDMINRELWYKRIFLFPAKYNMKVLSCIGLILAICSCVVSILVGNGILIPQSDAFTTIRLIIPIVFNILVLCNSCYRRMIEDIMIQVLKDLEKEDFK